ncbi:sugar-binding protein [Leadbettera azotonutricia]|uniref:Putative lipoprotein n=1 Tax=Leadbettera azotonutricia (strain ATCC BAA-888 / DSM 13862 / ZAS-9) TaxID=545695 RepID=F5YES4_LEAAZ|nr:sugar-binding protein [Leadbettera azotonutricia]AEF81595.1 putative lipoprotein [Leadbettera azotonutricia ZAS-9]
MKKRFLCGLLAVLLVSLIACQNVLSSGSGPSGDKSLLRSVSDGFGNTYILPYSPYNYQVLLSKFVPSTVPVITSGTLNPAAWNDAPTAAINHFMSTSGTAAPVGYSTAGVLQSVWDGYTLYLAVDVTDSTPSNSSALDGNLNRLASPGQGVWNQFDAVGFNIDFMDDKYDKWSLDDGFVKVSRSGKLASGRMNDAGTDTGNGDETWADPFGQPEAREFTDRIKDWGAYENAHGYTAWLAIEIWAGVDPKNGMDFGFDVFIQDSPSNNQNRTAVTFWSHEINGYRFNNREGTLDWGTVVLTGHTAANNDDFAFSDWMLTNPIRWAKGDAWWPPLGSEYLINLPDSVENSWTPATWVALQTSIAKGKDLLTKFDTWGRPHVEPSVPQAEVIAAGQQIEAAIVSLVWADDLLGVTAQGEEVDRLNTLSDPLKFKTNGAITPNETIPGLTDRKGTLVSNSNDWKLRAREIKALAALYEYGPIPDEPASHSVIIQSTPSVPAHWEHPGWWIVGGLPSKVENRPGAYSLTASYTYTGTEHASWDGTSDTTISGVTALPGTRTNAYTFSFPSEAQKQANGVTGAVPVVVSFAGSTASYLQRGIAIVQVSTAVTTDARGNAGAWGPRGGTFRSFFPYERGQRYEISNEMAAAWGASRAVDALYDAAEIDLVERDITISNIVASDNYRLGDRLSTDGVTWWTVGQLNRPETPTDQLGTGGIQMLFLDTGAVPPAAGGNPVIFNRVQRIVGNGVYEERTELAGDAKARIVVGTTVPIGKKMKDVIDYKKLVTDGFSINGKYAFVAAVFDDRINLAIPGAAGATGPQAWRYNAAGNEYSWGSLSGYPSGGAELIGDNVLHNPGRANEVFRRFLYHYKWYVPLRGIDINGDISHGYADRLPFDNHELVASLYPRAIIERNTFNDYNDGSEGDAISMQAARIVYRRLIDLGVTGKVGPDIVGNITPAGRTASAEDLIKFNYRATGGHGTDPIQPEREAQYMAWYFYDKPMNVSFASHLNTDPFYTDVLVPGGSNSYNRHYGGIKVMMPWSWAGPYYPK